MQNNGSRPPRFFFKKTSYVTIKITPCKYNSNGLVQGSPGVKTISNPDPSNFKLHQPRRHLTWVELNSWSCSDSGLLSVFQTEGASTREAKNATWE